MAQFVHKLIKKTAVELAQEFYEAAAYDNAFRAAWPKRRIFVRMKWHTFIAQARDALVSCLDSPNLNGAQKDEIMMAIMLDRVLPQSGKSTPAAQPGIIAP